MEKIQERTITIKLKVFGWAVSRPFKLDLTTHGNWFCIYTEPKTKISYAVKYYPSTNKLEVSTYSIKDGVFKERFVKQSCLDYTIVKD